MKFVKGQSGNPGGRKRISKDILELARQAAPEALKQIIELSTECKDPRVRLAASQYLIDRSYGKPAQAMELTGKGGKDLIITVNIQEKKVRSGS